jgi:hypothetical protein
MLAGCPSCAIMSGKGARPKGKQDPAATLADVVPIRPDGDASDAAALE